MPGLWPWSARVSQHTCKGLATGFKHHPARPPTRIMQRCMRARVAKATLFPQTAGTLGKLHATHNRGSSREHLKRRRMQHTPQHNPSTALCNFVTTMGSMLTCRLSQLTHPVLHIGFSEGQNRLLPVVTALLHAAGHDALQLGGDGGVLSGGRHCSCKVPPGAVRATPSSPLRP